MKPQTLTSAAGAMPPRIANLPIRDPAARLYLLTRLILSFDESDQQLLIELVTCGFTPGLIDKLRHMSMVDALRFTANHCGLSLGVDAQVVRHQVERLERTRADHQMYESLIHAGASPSLISRLFAVAPDDVRRLRKLIAPTVVPGGRDRVTRATNCGSRSRPPGIASVRANPGSARRCTCSIRSSGASQCPRWRWRCARPRRPRLRPGLLRTAPGPGPRRSSIRSLSRPHAIAAPPGDTHGHPTRSHSEANDQSRRAGAGTRTAPPTVQARPTHQPAQGTCTADAGPVGRGAQAQDRTARGRDPLCGRATRRHGAPRRPTRCRCCTWR